MTVMSPQLKTKPKLGIRLKFDRLMKLVLRFALEKFQKVILEFFKDHSQIFFLNMMIVIGLHLVYDRWISVKTRVTSYEFGYYILTYLHRVCTYKSIENCASKCSLLVVKNAEV